MSTSYRKWCRNCQDWKIFTPELSKELTCNTCEIPIENYSLSEIPIEKLEEQRKRWKAYRQEEFNSFINFSNILSNYGSPIGYNSSNLVESDAGQQAIYDKKNADMMAEVARKKEELRKYHGLGRNDLCLCGSQKKYKKCCWSMIQSYK